MNVSNAESQRGGSGRKYADRLDPDTLIDNGSFCIGDPDACIKTIEMYEAAGVDQMLALLQVGNVPHEKIMNSLRLYGKYVIPHFKEKEKAAKAAAAIG